MEGEEDIACFEQSSGFLRSHATGDDECHENVITVVRNRTQIIQEIMADSVLLNKQSRKPELTST